MQIKSRAARRSQRPAVGGWTSPLGRLRRLAVAAGGAARGDGLAYISTRLPLRLRARCVTSAFGPLAGSRVPVRV